VSCSTQTQTQKEEGQIAKTQVLLLLKKAR